MLILGIESSCDETAVSLIERGERNRVLHEEIKSQIPLHKEYGGVVPEIASRTHLEYIDRLTARVLEKTGTDLSQIDLIALTSGPGLVGSLLVGLSFAKGLSYSRNIPLVPVDHIQAHIESAFIENPGISYPLIALVVSGGHTTLFHQTSKFNTAVVAKTRDDAVGEILDKAAKFFNLGYPGGPIIEKLYPRGNPGTYPFTIPKMSDGSADFSFSGYKTAIIRHAEKNNISPRTEAFHNLISSYMKSLVDYLLQKTKDAVSSHPVKSIVVAGGVSRNSLLRSAFSEEFKKNDVPLFFPDPRYCTDNASMIAWLGYEKFMHRRDHDYHNLNLNVYSRFKSPRPSE